MGVRERNIERALIAREMEAYERLTQAAQPGAKMPENPFSTQVGGNHYSKLKIQPFQYSLANGLGPAEHTVVKYVTRWRDKGGIRDLEKAKHVIDLLIAFEMEKRSAAPSEAGSSSS